MNLDSVSDNNVLVGSLASLLEKAGPASQEENKCGRKEEAMVEEEKHYPITSNV